MIRPPLSLIWMQIATPQPREAKAIPILPRKNLKRKQKRNKKREKSKKKQANASDETKVATEEKASDPIPTVIKNEPATTNLKQLRPIAVDIAMDALAEGKTRDEILNRLANNNIPGYSNSR